MPITQSFQVSLLTAAAYAPQDPVATGSARLPIQFAKLPVMSGILACILPSFTPLMQSIARTICQRNVNVANGASLTGLGKLVGLPRLTTVDDDFRRYVRAQIAVNSSFARFQDIINVAVLVLNDPTYTITLHNEGNATARLTIGGKAMTDALGGILTTLELAAVAIGVRLVIEWSNSTPAATFTFNAGPGFNVGTLASSVG